MSRPLFSYESISASKDQQHLHFDGVDILKTAAIANYSNPFILCRTSLVADRIAWIQGWKGLTRLHFAMKANYNRTLLSVIRKEGCGLDVVSLGEIQLALDLGFKPQDLIFSGVGKTAYEITWAIQNNIYQINIESVSELKRIQKITEQLNHPVNIGLRLNPEVDGKTHPNISTALKNSKFGLDMQDLPEVLNLIRATPAIQLRSLSFHVGSQITDLSVFSECLVKMKPLFIEIKKSFPTLTRFDLGGGLGIDYRNHDLQKDYDSWQALQKIYEAHLDDLPADYLLEMGRFVSARSSVLIAQVQYIKNVAGKKMAILDVGMNNLMRPSLYQAYHHVYPLKKSSPAVLEDYAVVGPICESSDVFHNQIQLPALQEGDFVALADVGAYGRSMASDYNLKPIAEEIFY